jgi:hypothetical protein
VLLQALCTVLLISRVRSCLWPRAGALADLAILASLGAATSLPWTTSELMPDLFTPLLVLGLFLLIFDTALRGAARLGLTLGLTAIMTFHLTNLPLYLGLCLTVLPVAAWLGARRLPWRWVITAPLLAVMALIAVNLIGAGRASISPFGATFYLARLLANGPARLTLGADCRHRQWALCPFQASIPASADAFLWTPDSPLYRAGGPKALIGQTRQIISRTIAEYPGTVARDAAIDTMRQIAMFRSGDGLRPWRLTAGATIRRDYPAAVVTAFDRSREARGKPLLPRWLGRLDRIMEILGLAGTGLVLSAGIARRRSSVSTLPWLAAMVLLALLGNAILTGSLSGPHDRYQSRVMWLPVLVVLLAAPDALSRAYARARRRSRPASTTI